MAWEKVIGNLFFANVAVAPGGGVWLQMLSGNILYGTTALGGANNEGTVFSLIVPEPASFALAAFGAAALLVRRRERKN